MLRFRDESGDVIRLRKLDMDAEWRNGAYDDDGNAVYCDSCGGEMKWHPRKHIWQCEECGREMDRQEYFEYIGAEPPGNECKVSCNKNYPFCKKICDRYEIDPDDPMLI